MDENGTCYCKIILVMHETWHFLVCYGGVLICDFCNLLFLQRAILIYIYIFCFSSHLTIETINGSEMLYFSFLIEMNQVFLSFIPTPV